GRVQVNGETVKIPQTLVDWQSDHIFVDGQKICSEEEKIYYMLNKPKGFICTSVRPGNKPIVLDLFPNREKRLFTVGRLDKESQGLLLVTNDGQFANQVIHPRHRIIKEYIVKTAQEITVDSLETLSEGARVDDRWVRPVSVSKVRRGTVRILVKEGKKHEVRILAEKAALDVLELTRIRIGGLVLGSLATGAFRTLSERDRQLLFSR
ncbi:MAG TPA: pseudouridine synthase, partial [Chlamydiales bacterium]|nr:pseudouridine synthase [Chlamydiales bacterium]